MARKKDYYTPPEVAEYFGVTLRTVYRWINKGTLKAVKIGQWHIAEADLQNLLKGDQIDREQ